MTNAPGEDTFDDLSAIPDLEEGTRSSEATSQPMDELFRLDPIFATDKQLRDIINRQVRQTISESRLDEVYNILILYNKNIIQRPDADPIYRALTGTDRSKPLLLVMYSPGGDLATAYLISKLCREFTFGQFHVAVPRQAKSAATLIACGADQIHMGSISELGPIDPQFGDIPALALKHSVEHIATLAAAQPDAAGMFAEYLAKSLRIEALGYYERVAESATQYAIRLLTSRQVIPDRDDHEVARRLVYEYKDHGFVIDASEAADIFGHGIVFSNTPEYDLANALYTLLDLMEWILGNTFERGLWFTGRDGSVVYSRAVG